MSHAQHRSEDPCAALAGVEEVRDMSRKGEPQKRVAARQRPTRYRDRMRAAGLRPVQIWAPDTRTASFARELRRQVAHLRGKPEERDAFDFIESIGASES